MCPAIARRAMTVLAASPFACTTELRPPVAGIRLTERALNGAVQRIYRRTPHSDGPEADRATPKRNGDRSLSRPVPSITYCPRSLTPNPYAEPLCSLYKLYVPRLIGFRKKPWMSFRIVVVHSGSA